MRRNTKATIFLLELIGSLVTTTSFLSPVLTSRATFIQKQQRTAATRPLKAKLPPSRVTDDYEREHEHEQDMINKSDISLSPDADLPTIDASDLPQLEYDASVHPIPSQPWRRGITDGAEEPIHAPWRVEAEQIIYGAVSRVGGRCEGVTWFANKCVVTVSADALPNVVYDTEGPRVIIHDTDERYNPRADFDWQNNPKFQQQELAVQYNLPETFYVRSDGVGSWLDVDAISTIAKSIMEALEDPDVDERLDITSRFEVILTMPGYTPNELEMQRDYDANVGRDVLVKTIDPFKSNRTLQGKLVSRDALDLKIEVKGRVVTVPLNFVDQVFVASIV